MTDTVFLLNYAILISAVVVSVFGLMTTLLIHDSNKADRRYFLCFFILLGLSSLAQLICELSKNAVLSQITMFASSLLSSMVMVPLLTYMLRCAGKNWKRNPFLYIVSGLWVGYLILLIVTQFTTFIYYFTPDNVYHRGPLYPLLLLPIILFLLINVISLFLYRSALTRRQRISFLAYLVIPLVCMFIQILFYGILLIAFGSTVAVFYMLVCFLIEQSEKSIRQAEENARQQASIHVLQMRPHFICNTMMSIYYLIPQDAQKAQQVTLDFTTYLRNNFTAIATPDTIPFEKELEHTRAFLAVEKVRHENQLFVEWDTPYTDFRLPPLTIQPIVPGMLTANNKEYLEGMTHVLTLVGDLKSPRDEVHIALRNELPSWVRQSSTESDTSTGGSFASTTLGLEHLMRGMFDAMKGGSSYFDVTVQLQR